MNKWIIDAYAWLEYLNGSEKGRKVAKIFEDFPNDTITSSATIAEVVSKVMRIGLNEEIAINTIHTLSEVKPVSSEIGILAGKIHCEAKKKSKDFGMLDAFVAATALQSNAKIVTGDEHFRQFKEVMFI